MSAPQQGRQSPDPETQTGAQKDTPADGGADVGGDQDSKSASEATKNSDSLQSNPEHPLDSYAEAKTSKEGRGPGI